MIIGQLLVELDGTFYISSSSSSQCVVQYTKMDGAISCACTVAYWKTDGSYTYTNTLYFQ